MRGEEKKRLQDEIAGADGHDVVELDGHLSAVDAGRVDLQQRVPTRRHGTDLALGGEGGRADEGKGLVARRPGVSVDCGQVDSVGALPEVGDLIARAGRRTALVEGIEVEGVDARNRARACRGRSSGV